MWRLICAVFLWLAIGSIPVVAQPTLTWYFGTPPGGIGASCSNYSVGYLTSAGQVVTCQVGVWTAGSAVSGGGTTAYWNYGTPTGACTAGIGLGYINSSGILYTCQSGTWSVSTGSATWGLIGGTLSSQTDLNTVLSAKEPLLGNPSTNGYCLTSTIAGTRSWAACGSGSSIPSVTNLIAGNGSGGALNSGIAASNVILATGTYANPSWLTALAWSKITSAPTFLTANQTITLSGDFSGSGATSISGTLATVNSSSGTCGDATHVCQVTTNNKGLTTNQTSVSITGGGGGGASSTSQLTDLYPTRTSTTLTIAPSCTSGAPCNVRFGDGTCSVTSAAVVTQTGAGSGSIYIGVNRSCNLVVYVPASTVSVTCDSHCSASIAPGFPLDGTIIPIATWASTSGTFASTGSDNRAAYSAGKKLVLAGGGFSYVETAYEQQLTLTGGGTSVVHIPFPVCSRDDASGNYPASGNTTQSAAGGSNNGEGPCLVGFNSTGATSVTFHHYLPSTWNSSGTMTLTFLWTQVAGGSGNVTWSVASACIAAGAQVYAPTLTYTANTSTVAVPSSSNLAITGITASNSGCAPGNFLWIKLTHTANGSGGTTYANTVYLAHAELAVTQ